jgi:hypothetical protein
MPRIPVQRPQPKSWWDWHQGWVLYPAAAASYAVVGMVQKPLLNWIVGPFWVLLVVWLLPAAFARIRRLLR